MDATLPETSAPADPAASEQKPFRMASLGRHSFIYAIGTIATKAVAFLMLPIYTRLLTPADYGVLQLAGMVLEVLSIFAGSRIAYGIFHFYHKASDDDSKRRVLSTAALLLLTTFGIAAAAAVVIAPQIAQIVFGQGGEYTTYLRLAALGMGFESFLIVPNVLFQLRQQSIKFVSFSLSRLVLQITLNLVLLIQFDMGVTGVLLSGVITNAVLGGFLTLRLLISIGPRFNWPVARDFLRFGIPLVAMQIATFMFTFGDRYFLNKAADTTTVGLYGLAYQFGFLVGMVGYMPIEMVWDPQRFAVARQPDRDVVFSRVFLFLNVTLITAAVGLSLFVGDVLRLIAGPEFQGASVYVPVIVGAYIFQAWGTFFNTGIMITERTGYYTVANWAAALVAMIGYFLLIPKYLAWGAAITVVASLGTRFALTLIFSQRLWRLNYDWKPVLRLLAVALLCTMASLAIPRMPAVTSVAVHTFFLLLYAGLVWRFTLGATDRTAILGILARLRAR